MDLGAGKQSVTQNTNIPESLRKQIKFTTWRKKPSLQCRAYEKVDEVEELLRTDTAYKEDIVSFNIVQVYLFFFNI